jgi:hypothetical protein
MQVADKSESARLHQHLVKSPEQEKQSKFADLHSFHASKADKARAY